MGEAVMRKVKTLGLLGTGVIGGGWAARALHFGIDVIAADVKPEMEAWIRGAVANAEPALARLTFAPLPPKGTLSFTTDLRTMAERADFIQENIPEQLALKQRMLAEVSRYAGPDVIIASSTSGLTPTDLQRDMVAPERFLVAHRWSSSWAAREPRRPPSTRPPNSSSISACMRSRSGVKCPAI
jgi:carnitine 3-dehydrogenase